MKNPITSVKKFVNEKKTTILGTVAVVSTTCAVLMKLGLNSHDNFLKEKGLYNEYYTPED